MQINSIKQRPADLAHIALEDAPGAAALVRRIPMVTTRTPVQISTATRAWTQNGARLGATCHHFACLRWGIQCIDCPRIPKLVGIVYGGKAESLLSKIEQTCTALHW